MNRVTLLDYYDKLAVLVDKLPGGLQKPIMRELTPIREVFLEQRPARLLIVGDSGLTIPEFLSELSNIDLIQSGAGEAGWMDYHAENRGSVSVVDARGSSAEWLQQALAKQKPDLIVVLRGEKTAPLPANLGDQPAVGILFGNAREFDFRTDLEKAGFKNAPVFSLQPDGRELLAHALCAYLPNAAKLEFARLTGARKAQAELARTLLSSFSAICGVIGTQPIPMADLPVLTSLQTLMVGLIIYVSGQKVGPKLIAEFLGAMGVNFGAGLLMREGARTVVRFIPGFGGAVSGFIAGGGTYLIGRAAIGYFIEGIGIRRTRQLIKEEKRRLK